MISSKDQKRNNEPGLTSEDFDALAGFFEALASFDFDDQKLAVEAAPSPSGSAASGASQK